MSDRIEANLNNPTCASRRMLDLLANKWSARVMYELARGPKRYNAIQRGVEGISYKMLTITLRDLERSNLVHREAMPVIPPHVEYSLTPLGQELLGELIRLVHWGFDHAEDLGW
jgi:DNA-binding HxlR family transcriptional regulator